jgi:hypothetical protein
MIASNGRAKHGAGICVPDCGARFEFLRIIDNYADYNGGGMYHTGHVVKMLSVEFKNNQADLRGGGVYMEGANAHVLGNPRFIGNTARVAGGGAAIMSARGIDRWFPSKNGGKTFLDYCRHICQFEYNVNALVVRTVMSRYATLGCFYFSPSLDGNKKEVPASCSFNDMVYTPKPAVQRTSTPVGATKIVEVWEFDSAADHTPSNLIFEMNMALQGGAVYVAGGAPSVSFAEIYYNSAGRRTESEFSIVQHCSVLFSIVPLFECPLFCVSEWSIKD